MQNEVRPVTYLGALTSLRFFVAMGVVLLHSGGAYDVSKSFVRSLGILNLMTYFFVLSGFLMFYLYPRIPNRKTLISFYVARFARVWPLHIVTMVMAFALMSDKRLDLFQPETWQRLLSPVLQLLMVHSWIPVPWSHYGYNMVSWSVASEVFLYLLFPVLLWNWNKRWPYLLALGGALVLAMIAIGDFAGVGFEHKPNHAAVNTESLVHHAPYTRVLEFLCGMWIASLHQRFGSGLGLNWRPRTWTGLEFLTLVLYVAGIRLATNIEPWVAENVGRTASRWIANSGSLFVTVPLILVFVQAKGRFTKLLSFAPLVVLGEMSYSIYLMHPIVIDISDRFTLDKPFEGWPQPLPFLILMGVVISVSYLTWKYFELPVRTLIVRAWKNRGQIALRRARVA